ncbi:MAG TPA: hypothetical protein VEI28_06340 [Thermodesulfovibrionales bacterium]|nr:hypothetical protein [Thermodesulfovibrionales bacterium]
MRRLAQIAFWLSLLFLPFKGPAASLILLITLLCLFVIFRYLWVPLRPFLASLQLLGKKGYAKSVALLRLRGSRYVVVLALLGLPFVLENYVLDISILTGIYAILAMGLNVVVGFTGLLNLGYVAFYAIGAYAYALLHAKIGLGFWTSLPLCIGLTTLSGFVLSIPALRLRGDYLAIVSLGFGEIVRLILNNWDSLTNGPNGISRIPTPFVLGFSLGGLKRYYYLILLFVILTYAVVKRVRFSKIGRAWMAIREDEICASTMGIHTTRYKLYAFSFGSLWAGLAGTLFAAKMQFVSPESFTFMESVLILCMVILGGIGSLPGVVVGAFILVMLPEVLREVQSYRMLALGAGLILIMVFRPQGLLGGPGSVE